MSSPRTTQRDLADRMARGRERRLGVDEAAAGARRARVPRSARRGYARDRGRKPSGRSSTASGRCGRAGAARNWRRGFGIFESASSGIALWSGRPEDPQVLRPDHGGQAEARRIAGCTTARRLLGGLGRPPRPHDRHPQHPRLPEHRRPHRQPLGCRLRRPAGGGTGRRESPTGHQAPGGRVGTLRGWLAKPPARAARRYRFFRARAPLPSGGLRRGPRSADRSGRGPARPFRRR